MHLTTSAADFSKETLVVKEEETYDTGAFEKVEAEVVKLLKEPPSLVEPPPGSSIDHEDGRYGELRVCKRRFFLFLF